MQVRLAFVERNRLQKATGSAVHLARLPKRSVHSNSRLCQDKAREQIPVETLHAQAHLRVEANPSACFDEELLKCLLQWFKGEYFKWVDAPPCDNCNLTTTSVGAAPATPEESRHGGHRVELYMCVTCRAHTRFPRYNDPAKLMETRRGRCGEWANVFTLFCKAMGYEARYVLDFTDHVWTEVYSQRQKRWIHCDSCEGEGSFDNPLLYEAGWGKKLDYAFAFSAVEVVDVIRRYTAKIDEVRQRRTLVDEAWLKNALEALTLNRRAGLSPSARAEVEARSLLEAQELSAVRVTPTAGALAPRQSGSVEW
ncbi:hypothetical protein BDK51DRAFT_24230, partial [Blyttiomyces helicus]